MKYLILTIGLTLWLLVLLGGVVSLLKPKPHKPKYHIGVDMAEPGSEGTTLHIIERKDYDHE